MSITAPSRLMAGAAIALAILGNTLFTGAASAASLSSSSSAAVPAGTTITITGAGFAASENVGFWVNVPSGISISNNSLGQTDSVITSGVIGIDKIATTDATGAFSYSLDTAGLPSGSYSLVAEGLTSKMQEVVNFSIDGALSAAPLAASSTTVAPGDMITINGTAFTADEPVSFWLNVPAGASIGAFSLGQTNTTMDGNVVPLDAMTSADSTGAFTYSLNTTGLPDGNYSLVAHGLYSSKEQTLGFRVSGAPASQPQFTSSASTVAAGTMMMLSGTLFQPNEAIGFWLNVPAGTVIAADALGQSNTSVVDGNIVALNSTLHADSNGAFTFTLNTTGLPSGSYSLVAHGLKSGITTVYTFNIQ